MGLEIKSLPGLVNKKLFKERFLYMQYIIIIKTKITSVCVFNIRYFMGKLLTFDVRDRENAGVIGESIVSLIYYYIHCHFHYVVLEYIIFTNKEGNSSLTLNQV